MYVSENKEFSHSKRMDEAVVFRAQSLLFQQFIIFGMYIIWWKQLLSIYTGWYVLI